MQQTLRNGCISNRLHLSDFHVVSIATATHVIRGLFQVPERGEVGKGSFVNDKWLGCYFKAMTGPFAKGK